MYKGQGNPSSLSSLNYLFNNCCQRIPLKRPNASSIKCILSDIITRFIHESVIFIWGYENPFVFNTLSPLSDLGKQYEHLIKA